jgi:hypothetical protein
MKKILESNPHPEFPKVFCHLLDDGTIDIVRQDQRFTIIGRDFTLIGTNPGVRYNHKTVIRVVDGKLIEDNIKFKEDEDGKEKISTEENGDNGQERQSEGNQPGQPDSNTVGNSGSDSGEENPGGSADPEPDNSGGGEEPETPTPEVGNEEPTKKSNIVRK